MVTHVQPRPVGKYFDEFSIGDCWESPARTITETDLVVFAGFSGDYYPLHTDAEYARKSQFGARIMHGPGVFAIANGLATRTGIKEGTAIASLGMTWWIERPVFIGDTIRVRERVAKLRPSRSKPNRGIVTFDVEVRNQRDDVCHRGEWVVLFVRTPA